MFKTAQLAIILSLATIIPAECSADLVLKYTGVPFTSVTGTDFTDDDFITAIVTFDSVNATAAKAFSLSTTMGGQHGFTLSVPDVNNLPPELTLSQNVFSEWENSVPGKWRLEVYGNVVGSDGEEQLGIEKGVGMGDLAIFDFASSGSTTVSGTWSVVPEPSSFCLAGIAFGFGLLGMWRGRRKPAA